MERCVRIVRLIVAATMAFACLTPLLAHADSEPTTTGPTVVATPGEVAPGSTVRLTIDGYRSPYVTMIICGNEARRGSGDCALTASVANEFNDPDQPMVYNFTVVAPPVDCPCIVRVVGGDTSEVAVAPIVITGHPVGPLVDPPVVGPLVKVGVSARTADMPGLDGIRSALGGDTAFEVTVAVRNVSDIPLASVKLSGTGGRDNNDIIVSLPLDDPGLIGVGQTWRQTVTVTVPAPSFGELEWRVTASGAGPVIDANVTTQHRPWLVVVLTLVAVGCVMALVLRTVVRARDRRRNESEAEDDEAAAEPSAESPATASPDSMAAP